MFKKLRTFFHPERFQGWGRRRKYFEGWYFKVVTRDKLRAFAIIPGIAYTNEGEGHAFVQVLDGMNGTSEYITFDEKALVAFSDRFEVRVGKNVFTINRMVLDLPEVKGELSFSETAGWPSTVLRPGIMGPYAFAPFMQCYHGIVSMDHEISGSLSIEGQTIDFTGGRGYTEKDWGSSFPSAYVWMQSNHFEEAGISFKASIARIPWLTGSFTGFISFFWFRGELILFATYNKGILERMEVTDSTVYLDLSNPRYKLSVVGLRSSSTHLAAPVLGSMEGRIEESLKAELHITLSNRLTGERIFSGVGSTAGLDIAGPIETLVPESAR